MKKRPKAKCLHDPLWRYTRPEDMAPDYLARKFTAIQRRMQAEKAQQEAASDPKVVGMRRKG